MSEDIGRIEWTSGRVDERVVGRVDEWTSGRVDEWTSGRVAVVSVVSRIAVSVFQ